MAWGHSRIQTPNSHLIRHLSTLENQSSRATKKEDVLNYPLMRKEKRLFAELFFSFLR